MAPKVNGEVAPACAAPGIPEGAAAVSTSTGGGPGLWKEFLVDLLGDKANEEDIELADVCLTSCWLNDTIRAEYFQYIAVHGWEPGR